MDGPLSLLPLIPTNLKYFQWLYTYYHYCTTQIVPFLWMWSPWNIAAHAKKNVLVKSPYATSFFELFWQFWFTIHWFLPLAFSPVSHCGDRIMIYGNSTQLHWNKFKKEPVLELSTRYVSQQIAKNLQKNSKIIHDCMIINSENIENCC